MPPDPVEGSDEKWWKETRLRRWWLRRREDARLIRDLSFYRERDPEENERSKPPEDESCQLAAVWVCEVFTPSSVGSLVDGLVERGWDLSRGRQTDLVEWIAGARTGGSGAWQSVGFVRRRGEGFADLRDDLPKGIRAADLTLTAVTPSVTVLTGCFFLDDDAASSYHNTLAHEYVTTLKPMERDEGRPLARLWWRIRYGPGWLMVRGHRVQSPQFARRDAARDNVTNTRNSCRDWLRDRFPGSFSRASDPPGAVLLMTEIAKPNQEESLAWMRAAGIGRSWEAWQTEELPDCSLTLPGYRFEDVPHLLKFSLRREDAADWKGTDDTSNWSLTFRLTRSARGLLAKWASLILLTQQRELLASLRDLTPGKREFRVVRDLREVRSTMLGSALDAELLATELTELASNEDLMRYYTVEFSREGRDAGRTELLDILATNIAERASETGTTNRLLTETANSVTSLTAAISNIRLQRTIVVITLVLVLLAVLALAVASGDT